MSAHVCTCLPVDHISCRRVDEMKTQQTRSGDVIGCWLPSIPVMTVRRLARVPASCFIVRRRTTLDARQKGDGDDDDNTALLDHLHHHRFSGAAPPTAGHTLTAQASPNSALVQVQLQLPAAATQSRAQAHGAARSRPECRRASRPHHLRDLH